MLDLPPRLRSFFDRGISRVFVCDWLDDGDAACWLAGADAAHAHQHTPLLQGFGETYPPNPKVVSDMTSLHNINEAGILHNLGERSKLRNQRPYTFMVSLDNCRFIAAERARWVWIAPVLAASSG